MREVQIHIAAGDAALARVAAGADLLDPGEQTQAARLRYDRDRDSYRAAHVLLRRALSQQAGHAPAHWRFVRSAHGRPEIDRSACPDADGLRFNLSHTRGLVCCAVVQDLPVGIDAECRRPLRDARAIAERFFAAEEAAAVVAAGPPGSAAEAAIFHALWTLKEAYVKALGRGLSMGLGGFAFRFADGRPAQIGLRTDDTEYSAAHWRCLLLRLDGGRCTLAVALPAPEGARFQVHLYGGDGAQQPGTPDPAAPHLDVAAITPGVALVPALV